MDSSVITFSGMNIHRLQSKKDFANQKECENFISRIFENYAKKVKDEAYSPNYSPITMSWDPKEHHGFHINLYESKHPTQTSFARWVEAQTSANYNASVIHFICFLFRRVIKKTKDQVKDQWEIFALTTHDGYRVVKPYADFNFPIRIAARLINPELLVLESKSLAGHKESSRDTYRQEYDLKQHELDSIVLIFKSFHAHFQMGSSLNNPLYKVTAFLGNQKKFQKRKVECGVGKVVIGGKLTFRQHEEILIHFSRIARKEQTFKLVEEGGEEKSIEEVDNPAWHYLENIQPVGKEIKHLLDKALLKLVWKAYSKKDFACQLTFVHRYHRDFYSSSEFCLRYQGREIRMYYRPSLKEILFHIRLFIGLDCPFEHFTSKLEQVTLKFDRHSGCFPIREFFHGEIRYGGEAFFCIDGVWLKVHAGHLTVIQRAFSRLLRDHLIDFKAVLPKPWFAKRDWAAFTLDHVKEATNRPETELLDALKKLETSVFAFLDADGHVLCPYPTFCLLEDLSVTASKRLKKNWEEFGLFLKEKQQKKESVISEELKVYFNKDQPQAVVDQFLLSLKKKRPVLVKRSVGKAIKAIVLTSAGVPLVSDLSKFTFSVKTLEDNKEKIEPLLKRKQICTVEDIKGVLPKKVSRHAKSVLEALQAPNKVNERVEDSNQYLLQGPLPEGEPSDVDTQTFLLAQHENYKSILPEEGYNRLYLGEKGYLVCDQVYSNKQEKVEYFDILHFNLTDPKAFLELIHVKEGFGQKTREACAQIRVSATVLGKALNGDLSNLKKLYDQATREEATSPFRKKLRETFLALPTDEECLTPKDAFIRLFTKAHESGRIRFIYAFVDDAEKERQLDMEQNPAHAFQEQDFAAFSQDHQKLYKKLKEKRYLDDRGRLADPFLRLTKAQFCQEMSCDNKEKVFDFLDSKVSQFDSLVAKIELLQLKEFLKSNGLNFDFKICQVSRSMTSTNKSTHTFLPEFSDEEWREIEIPTQTTFIYEDNTYYCVDEKYDTLKLVYFLVGGDPKQLSKKDLGLRLYRLFNQHKNQITTDWKEHFETKKGASSTKKKKSPSSSQQNNLEDFDKYLLELLKEFKIFGHELEMVAFCLNLKLIFLSNVTSEQLKEKVIFNFEGTTERVIIQEDNSYQLAYLEGSDVPNTSLASTSLDYSTAISVDLQKEVMSQECFVGIQNWGNDCFFNAAIQMLFHSPICQFLMNPEKVDRNGGKANDLHVFLRELNLSYHFSGSSSARYSRETMRRLLGFSASEQEDASEAIVGIFKNYQLEDICSTFEYVRQPDTKKASHLSNMSIDKEKVKYSKVNKGLVITFHQEPMLSISLNTKLGRFQEYVDQLFKKEKVESDFTYIKGKKLYRVASFEQTLRKKELKDVILFQVKRFDFDTITGKTNKIDNSLNFDQSQVEIEKQLYELKGFIVHIGSDPKSGHYVAYCHTSLGWKCFNDSTVADLSDESALEKANDAYVLCFTKKSHSRCDFSEET